MYYSRPKNFRQELKVAACIIDFNGKILLVQQAGHKSSPGEWLEPGGKIELGETPQEAMLREIFEETSIKLKGSEVKRLFKRYFIYKGVNISIVFFHATLTKLPNVEISEEHSNFLWIDPKEALRMNLIEDFDEIIREVYKM